MEIQALRNKILEWANGETDELELKRVWEAIQDNKDEIPNWQRLELEKLFNDFRNGKLELLEGGAWWDGESSGGSDLDIKVSVKAADSLNQSFE